LFTIKEKYHVIIVKKMATYGLSVLGQLVVL